VLEDAEEEDLRDVEGCFSIMIVEREMFLPLVNGLLREGTYSRLKR